VSTLIATVTIFSASYSAKACPEAKKITEDVILNLTENPQTRIDNNDYILVDPTKIKQSDFGNAKPLQTAKLLKEFTTGKMNKAYVLRTIQVTAKPPYCVYNIGFVKPNEATDRAIIALQKVLPPKPSKKGKAQD
jgi:hypothetical protein